MHSLKRILGIINPYYKHSLKRCLTSKSCENVEVEAEQKEKSVITEHFEEVTLIGINRPEKKNCLNVATAQLLSDEIDKFENDEKCAIGVLHGIGGNFCSGYDLAEISQYNGENEEVLPQFGPLANKIDLCKKPLIAAISGYAVGVGFELALMCDLRVMEETAVMGFLNRRFGIPILCGGTVRLPALIGYSRAMDLILTGRGIEIKEAFSWGLINRCTATGTALGDTLNLAKSFTKFSQRTLLADRASSHYATFSAKQLEEAIQFEKDNASHLLFEEGVKGAKMFVHEGIGRHGKTYNLKSVNRMFKEFDEKLL
ncbi:3-hydroxypropionyl-coenzyme A dehydratase [Habropoda laboriosa]|uniref:3-hydroxypropionyl-coenzyme A dehydratase n=1 Tax=Habropoda laboriosa TaxID=597456 RepID=A0A0L7RGB9_9HYME|nr:PREDICTED: probable enoyl-CoA hydratase [Habropoda laboriosa]KOC69900.1 3-hydroxypropionyl-coenzyme A dehydratase [Habropoda laboriosa]